MGWLSGWDKRVKVTVLASCVDTGLSNFPFLIKLDSSHANAIRSEVGANTKKIAACESNGTTQCNVEIQQFTAVADSEILLWVKGPTISSSADTDFYLYYDSGQADNTTYVGDTGDTPAQAVWDSNFVLVSHMNQDPTGGTGCIKDSTSNAFNGTPEGSMTSGDLVAGEIGKALEFDGSNDAIIIPDNASLDITGALTMECIFKPANAQNNSYHQYGKGVYSFAVDHASADYRGSIALDSTGGWCHSDGPNTITQSVFQYLAGVYDGTYLRTYINSAEASSNNVGTRTINTNNYPFVVGAKSDSATTRDYHMAGVIDEVRLSNLNRSAAWLKATYHSNWNTLSSYGNENIFGEYTGDITATLIPEGECSADHEYTGDITATLIPESAYEADGIIYETDFSEYATGSPPADWTERWTPADASYSVLADGDIGGKILAVDVTANGFPSISWDDVDSIADVEMLVLFRRKGTSTNAESNNFIVRGVGVTPLHGYFLEFQTTSGQPTLKLGRCESGSYTQIGSAVNLGSGVYAGADSWNWVRFQCRGTALKAKLWDASTAEPASWQVEETDSNITAAGWSGFGHGNASAYDYDVDYFALGSGTDSPAVVRFYTGDITATLTPESECGADHEYTGDITATLIPESAYETVADHEYTGDITATLIPESECGTDHEYTGDITATLIPESAYETTVRLYTGDITATLIPESAYEKIGIIYKTDFSEYSTGSAPPDWTERWVTASAALTVNAGGNVGGKVLNLNSTSDARYTASWDDAGSSANTEILCLFQATDNLDNVVRLTLRGSGTSGNETGYLASMQVSTNLIQLGKYVGGASSNITNTAYTFSANTWYWCRFRANGTNLKAKVWTTSINEPSAWNIETTDSSITAAGWAGTGKYTGDSNYDYFAISTAGETPAVVRFYTGDVTATIIPESECSADYEYTGDVTATIIPESLYASDHPYAGDITATLAPEGEYNADYVNTGDITITFIPESECAYGRYIGHVTFELTPESSHSADYLYAGSTELQLISESDYDPEWDYTGSTELQLIPEADYDPEWDYTGSTELQLIPEADSGASVYVGSVELQLIPESDYEKAAVYEGDVTIHLIPDSICDMPREYVGDVTISLDMTSRYVSPISGYDVFTGYGLIDLSFLSAEPPWYCFRGDVPLSLTTADTEASDYMENVYTGTAYLKVLGAGVVTVEYPDTSELVASGGIVVNSEGVSEFVYPEEDVFSARGNGGVKVRGAGVVEFVDPAEIEEPPVFEFVASGYIQVDGRGIVEFQDPSEDVDNIYEVVSAGGVLVVGSGILEVVRDAAAVYEVTAAGGVVVTGNGTLSVVTPDIDHVIFTVTSSGGVKLGGVGILESVRPAKTFNLIASGKIKIGGLGFTVFSKPYVFGVVSQGGIVLSRPVDDVKVYHTWVITGTTFEPSIYSGFDFNSYAFYRGKAYGLKDDGLYLLEGDTDDGNVIHSGIDIGEKGFKGTSKKKVRSIRVIDDSLDLNAKVTDGTRDGYYTFNSNGKTTVSRNIRGKKIGIKIADFDKIDAMGIEVLDRGY